MSVTLAELAERFGCELHGDGATRVDNVGTLANAGGRAVSFLANPRYLADLGRTKAAAVVLEARHRDDCPVSALVAPNPYATYARIARFLHPLPAFEPGVHPTAVVAADADVAATAHVGAHAVIGAGARIADAVSVGAGAVVGSRVAIGAASILHPRVTVMGDSVIGERCVLHPGVVVGSDGFGFAREDQAWIGVPQLGRAVIGDDVDIGANTTIDRGTIDDTVIGPGVKLDNLIQIGHNVRVGAHTAMAALCGIAGSTRIGKRCMFGGAVVVVGHLTICDDVLVTFHSTVLKSITEPGTYSGALAADKASRWRRNAARFGRLAEAAPLSADTREAPVAATDSAKGTDIDD
ncbi:MAG TPA: UDP-3-O-(3-hydroxymyristoyl)glucosamine N-acyltransferase [Gammaproteobacteria bacterium]|jgi:UDP-3-O-[3-hydroxymyristoyl] glucosamine N-acyltransferase